MKQNKLLWALFFVFIVLALVVIAASCNDDGVPDEGQKNTSIDKHGTVDIQISQTNANDTAYFQTRKTYYDKLASPIKETITYDTVVGLGMIKDTVDTGRTDTEDNEIDSLIISPKKYQIYITIK